MMKKDIAEKLQSSIDKVAVSVSDLAIMMKEGFDDIHEKFATKEDVDNGFEKIYENFATREEMHRDFATKKDHNNLELKIDKIDNKIDKLVGTLDTIVYKMDKTEAEGSSNISAHDRMNRDLFRLKEHTGLKSMEVVGPLEP